MLPRKGSQSSPIHVASRSGRTPPLRNASTLISKTRIFSCVSMQFSDMIGFRKLPANLGGEVEKIVLIKIQFPKEIRCASSNNGHSLCLYRSNLAMFMFFLIDCFDAVLLKCRLPHYFVSPHTENPNISRCCPGQDRDILQAACFMHEIW